MSKSFVGFGELLVRLAPSGYLRFPQADSFTVNYTGAEGNMAVALSYMGVPAKLVTKLPDNEIGRCAMRKLAAYGVDTHHIVWGGERLGLYYLERAPPSAPPRSFTTGPAPPSPRPTPANLTGMRSWRMRGGSILPASPPA